MGGSEKAIKGRNDILSTSEDKGDWGSIRGGWEISIGECKGNSKQEKYFTAEELVPGGWKQSIDQGKQCKMINSRTPGWLRVNQGCMGLSIGNFKENSKPKENLTPEYQGWH